MRRSLSYRDEAALNAMWTPVFLCVCGQAMHDRANDSPVCRACGALIPIDDAIYRCLTSERRARLTPFLAQYRHVRQRDGYRVSDGAYYRALPHVLDGTPQEAVWRIRQQSFDRLCPMILRDSGQAPAILDLGAGSGWLSHRVAALGGRPVAVDVLVDKEDGLGACRHYDLPFARVEADFDVLPFAPGQFDAVVFNGSLHYAPDVDATLEGASRMLRAGGVVAVIDSPMFARDADGRAMRLRLEERLRSEYDIAAPLLPGEAFLTFARMSAWAERRGYSAKFFASRDGLRTQVQRSPVGRLLGRVAPPQFGVWVAS
jgi:SAM-dependent methyltransferase